MNQLEQQDDRYKDDRGETMLMTVILISFLMVAAWALLSASQQWGARRDVQGVAAAAARAAVQVEGSEIRGNTVTIDTAQATARANEVLSRSGYSGSVRVNGLEVTVTATGSITYAFPSPGFPTQFTATSSAVASRGVIGNEGG